MLSSVITSLLHYISNIPQDLSILGQVLTVLIGIVTLYKLLKDKKPPTITDILENK